MSEPNEQFPEEDEPQSQCPTNWAGVVETAIIAAVLVLVCWLLGTVWQ